MQVLQKKIFFYSHFEIFWVLEKSPGGVIFWRFSFNKRQKVVWPNLLIKTIS